MTKLIIDRCLASAQTEVQCKKQVSMDEGEGAGIGEMEGGEK